MSVDLRLKRTAGLPPCTQRRIVVGQLSVRCITFDVLGVTKGASQIGPHPRLVLPAERLEQREQALECLRANLLPKVPLDLTGAGP